MDDDLWALTEPLLPPWPEKSPGARPVADRLCRRASCTSCTTTWTWQLLPLEPGFGSGQTCWRRLERWQQAGTRRANATRPARAWTAAPTSARKRGRRHWFVAGRPTDDG
ncbi:transposase [Streptomyces sp. Ru87]|uniref:transposase n=1 Tax=Streptomyces sp. Ru87 TaxID=2044307 RepID=UPI0015D47415